jgi:hypothetical protein
VENEAEKGGLSQRGGTDSQECRVFQGQEKKQEGGSEQKAVLKEGHVGQAGPVSQLDQDGQAGKANGGEE